MSTYNARPQNTPKPSEAPLHPHHPSNASHLDLPDPVYGVTPRHLAGDDDALAERVGDTLAGPSWRMWPSARHTLLYVSPDGLCGAEWVLATYRFELGGLPVAWQLSARSHAASVMAEWNACFTTGFPYEALADLLVAIDASNTPDVGFEGPETVLNALCAGWIREVDRPRTTVMDPGFASSVSLGMVPPLIEDADPRPDLVGWQAWAEPALGAPYLWCASFSASVPHDLVAAFTSSLASPVPVPAAPCPRAPRAGSPSLAAADDPCPDGAAVVRLVADLAGWRARFPCPPDGREEEDLVLSTCARGPRVP